MRILLAFACAGLTACPRGGGPIDSHAPTLPPDHIVSTTLYPTEVPSCWNGFILVEADQPIDLTSVDADRVGFLDDAVSVQGAQSRRPDKLLLSVQTTQGSAGQYDLILPLREQGEDPRLVLNALRVTESGCEGPVVD